MDFFREDENIGQKLDRINNFLITILKDPNISRTESDNFSSVSHFNSFTEDFTNFRDPFREFPGSYSLPPEIQDKFQENLTEIDRLNMKIEDLFLHISRSENAIHEIFLSKAQIISLKNDLKNLTCEDSPGAVLKIAKDFFILESFQKPDKILYSSTINSSNKSLEDTLDFTIDLNSTASRSDLDLLKIQASYELKSIQLAKKEENLRAIEENLGNKIREIEDLKIEYNEKLSKFNLKESIIKHSNSFKNRSLCLSNDFTQDNDYFKENESNSQKFQKIMDLIEEIDKNKRFGEYDEDQEASKIDFVAQYFNERMRFSEKIMVQQYSEKEKHLENYFKSQGQYLDKKMEEIQEYERFLQETWVDSLGHANAVTALQKASKRNFVEAMKLKEEREYLEKKIMWTHKMLEIVKDENGRLEFHRRKIISERQNLLKLQTDIENLYEKIAN